MTSLPGRSLRAGQCTVAELAALTKGFAIGRNYISDELASYANDSVIVDGDLVIDGDLDTFALGVCRLVVTGALRVRGLYRDYDDPQTAVFVLGDFEAGRAITSGALAVAGDVTVHDALVGYYNDHSAELHGDVRARVFAPENHFFTIHRGLAAQHVVGSGAEYRVPPKLKAAAMPVDDGQLRELLVAEVLEIEDYGDPTEPPEVMLAHRELRQRVADGAPLLKADTGAPIVVPTVPAPAPAKKKKKPAPKPTKKKKPAPKPTKKKKAAPVKKKKPAPKPQKKKQAAPAKRKKRR
jgi:hypothetical protein